MRKVLFILFLLVYLVSGIYATEMFEDSTDIPAKYNVPTIHERGTFRIMAQAESFNPSLNKVDTNNDPSLASSFALIFKTNDAMDQYIKAGMIASRKLVTAAGTDAAYSVTKIGYGVNLYLNEWIDFMDASGLLNLYATGGIDFYNASRTALTSGSAPTGYSGMGATVGLGLEFIFSPVTTAIVEASYQRSSLVINELELPLDGLSFAAGARISIF